MRTAPAPKPPTPLCHDTDTAVVAEYEECSGYRRQYRVIALHNPVNGDYFQGVYDVPERQIFDQDLGPRHESYADACAEIGMHLERLPDYTEPPTIHNADAQKAFDNNRAAKSVKAQAEAEQKALEEVTQAEIRRKNAAARQKIDELAKAFPNKKGGCEIQTNEGVKKTVSGIRVGWFLVHKSSGDYVPAEEKFTVTHVPSGLKAGASYNQADAKALALMFGRKGDWSKVKPMENKATLEWARLVRDSWKNGDWGQLI